MNSCLLVMYMYIPRSDCREREAYVGEGRVKTGERQAGRVQEETHHIQDPPTTGYPQTLNPKRTVSRTLQPPAIPKP
jgi:hypothetical protein